MTSWTVTVNELIGIFRDALVALVPVVERARIPWREDESYDDWDAISTVLFETIVVASVRSSLSFSDQAAFKMPPYDLLVDSYDGLTYIEVTSEELDAPAAFHSFGTTKSPFDTVRVRVLDRGRHSDAPDLLKRLTAERVKYSLRIWTNGIYKEELDIDV